MSASSRSLSLSRTPLPSTRMSCTPPPSPPALSLLAPPSCPPSLLHFPTLLLLLHLLRSSPLWMPSSLTVWTREGKEKRVGWRTSGRNGIVSLLFLLLLFLNYYYYYWHAATWLAWPCECNSQHACFPAICCLLKARGRYALEGEWMLMAVCIC